MTMQPSASLPPFAPSEEGAQPVHNRLGIRLGSAMAHVPETGRVYTQSHAMARGIPRTEPDNGRDVPERLFLRLEDKIYGPIAVEELRRLLGQSRLTGYEAASKDLAHWTPIAYHPSLVPTTLVDLRAAHVFLASYSDLPAARSWDDLPPPQVMAPRLPERAAAAVMALPARFGPFRRNTGPAPALTSTSPAKSEGAATPDGPPRRPTGEQHMIVSPSATGSTQVLTRNDEIAAALEAAATPHSITAEPSQRPPAAAATNGRGRFVRESPAGGSPGTGITQENTSAAAQLTATPAHSTSPATAHEAYREAHDADTHGIDFGALPDTLVYATGEDEDPPPLGATAPAEGATTATASNAERFFAPEGEGPGIGAAPTLGAGSSMGEATSQHSGLINALLDEWSSTTPTHEDAPPDPSELPADTRSAAMKRWAIVFLVLAGSVSAAAYLLLRFGAGS